MGFLDKVREQGSALASKAQEGLSQGQAKLDEAQARKKGNDLLAQLGAWDWATAHGRDGGAGPAEMERLRGELATHEAEHGEIAPPEVAAPEPPPAPLAETTPPPPPGAPTESPPPGD